MADGVAIVLDNKGDSTYAQSAREFLTNPISADMVRVMLTNYNQASSIIKVRNTKSIGTHSNRDVSLKNFINAMNRTSLIIDVPLYPPISLDGQTYFETEIEANSQIDLIFYCDQEEIGDIFK